MRKIIVSKKIILRQHYISTVASTIVLVILKMIFDQWFIMTLFPAVDRKYGLNKVLNLNLGNDSYNPSLFDSDRPKSLEFGQKLTTIQYYSLIPSAIKIFLQLLCSVIMYSMVFWLVW